jgi:hypothetical protein
MLGKGPGVAGLLLLQPITTPEAEIGDVMQRLRILVADQSKQNMRTEELDKM